VHSTKRSDHRLEQEGVMKDEIKYEVQFFDGNIDEWNSADVYWRKKDAKDAVREFRKFDKEVDIPMKYRIVKLTIKKEVVK
jgi:hypothetical protein